jgi:hypothetical protein
MRRVGVFAALGVAVIVASQTKLRAQNVTQAFQSEARVDGIFARTSGVQAGVGISVPAGIYVRTGLVAAAGAGRHGFQGRTDLFSRFSLDPFRQSRWAPYAGAGLSGLYRPKLDGGSKAYLLVYIGVEGPLPYQGRAGYQAIAGWVPFVEAGLGGGARIGIGFRRGVSSRR